MRTRILFLMVIALLPGCARDNVVSPDQATTLEFAPQASVVAHSVYDAPINNRFYAGCLNDTLVMTGTATYKIGVVTTPTGAMLIHQTAKVQLNPTLQVLSGTYWNYAGGAFEQWLHINQAEQDRALTQNIMLTSDVGGRVHIQRNVFVDFNANGRLVESRPAVYTCNVVK